MPEAVVFTYSMGSNRGASAGQHIQVLRVDTCALVCVCLSPIPARAAGTERAQTQSAQFATLTASVLTSRGSNCPSPKGRFQAEPQDLLPQDDWLAQGSGSHPRRCAEQTPARWGRVPTVMLSWLSRCWCQQNVPCPRNLHGPQPSPAVCPVSQGTA